MRLHDYIECLKLLEEKHGNLKLVYSSDDEGNGFYPVHFPPSVGDFLEDDNDWEDNEESPNAVCLN